MDGPPTVYIANEFFDALPVHQLQRTERGWCVASPYRRWQLAVPAVPKHGHTLSGACSRVISGTSRKAAGSKLVVSFESELGCSNLCGLTDQQELGSTGIRTLCAGGSGWWMWRGRLRSATCALCWRPTTRPPPSSCRSRPPPPQVLATTAAPRRCTCLDAISPACCLRHTTLAAPAVTPHYAGYQHWCG